MKTILITGCCGFIGSHLCDLYVKKRHKVIGLDNLLTGTYDNIRHLEKNQNFKFIMHDVCDEIIYKDKIDLILHFASPASPFDYLKYPIKTLRIGSVGTENILKLGLINNATVLVASTSEVYGDPLEHPQSETYYGNVNPIGPRGVYDEAKRYLEALTTAYKNKKKLNVRIARIFNTYGPRMRNDDGRAIPNFINQALKNKNITIYGDGTQTRSFSYITDTIDAIYKLVECDYQLPINIGNDTEYSINKLVEIIKSIIPTKSKIIHSNLPINDPKVRRPDITLAKKYLNWKPNVSLKLGINNTIDYYKNFYKFRA